MIQIDGSSEEGGGSILRLSLALSIHTKQPFKINNIRLHRKKPGLNSQNLASIELARQICNAKVVGARGGSKELEFYPNDIISKNIDIDIKSAGSIILALQSVFLPCMLSGKKYTFKIKGGTDVAWSPGYDFFNEVFTPFFENLGKIECRLLKRGYYPEGGGEVILKIESFKNLMIQPLNIPNIGRLIAIRGVSNASKDLERLDFANREANDAIAQLTDYSVPTNITRMHSNAKSTGAGLLIYGIFERENKQIFRTGIFRVSPKIKETMSLEVTSEFKRLINTDTPFDEFFADQIIPFLAIMTGQIKTTPIDEHLSKHLHANIYVIEQFLDRTISLDEKGFISCH